MSYPATVFQVMIASPGDVIDEANVAIKLIHEWNSNHAEEKQIILLPVHWASDATPAMGGRPQEIINKQLLEKSDLLVAIFGTRLGTPTGEAPSGAVEEINKHTAAGKPAMLYFSEKDTGKLNEEAWRQFQALTEFRKSLEKNQQGLIWRFSSLQGFEADFRNHLQRTIANHDYFKQNSIPFDPFGESVEGVLETPVISLSQGAELLLRKGAEIERGHIILDTIEIGFDSLYIGDEVFWEGNSQKELARWRAVLKELETNGFILKERNDDGVFSLTQKGFDYADKLPD